MDIVGYVEQWRVFSDRLSEMKGIESAQEIVRGYSSTELEEMEADLEERFSAPGFRLPEPLRSLIGASISLRVQWKVPREAPIVGSTRLTPLDVFESEEESGMEDKVEFWGTDRVLEPISDTESVVVVFDSPDVKDPSLFFRDGDERWPLKLTLERYLEKAWKYRGLYGWHRAIATDGSETELEKRLVSALGDLLLQ